MGHTSLQFFTQDNIYLDDDFDPITSMALDTGTYVLYISDERSFEVKSAAESRFNENYVGCIHWILSGLAISALPCCERSSKNGARACPPEDVGGVPGYYEFCKALKDPTHEEHESFMEWSGGDYDSEKFDANAVNWELLKTFFFSTTASLQHFCIFCTNFLKAQIGSDSEGADGEEEEKS